MKRRILGLSICLLSFCATIVSADTNYSQPSPESIIKSVHKKNKEKEAKARQSKSAEPQDIHLSTYQNPVTTTQAQMQDYITVPRQELGFIPMDIDVPGQSFVSTGPYIGVPLLYSGGNLIINSPNINEDVILLNIRKTINQRLRALGRLHPENHSHLLLSGIVEGQANYINPGRGSVQTDINLTSAELDGYILGPSSWTSALFTFAYDNNIGAQEGSLSSNTRVSNSRLYVDKAFIIIGDFEQSNFYGTIGQMYVPFGTYSSNMVSSTLTKLMARTKERAILLGYQQQGNNAFYASTYFYKGDTYIGSTSRVNSGGINVGYRYDYGSVINGDIGGGVIANLADSLGMQNTGNPSPQWGGFGGTGGTGNEQIKRRVPALDFRGLFSVGHVNLLAEFILAVTNFSPQDLTFNTLGANPQALNAEAAYTFTMFDRPTSIAVGYGRTKDCLALGLAYQRYSAVINTSWWKNTLQSLEFRHDINYPESNYATGSGVTTLVYGAGNPDTAITAQFDLYF